MLMCILSKLTILSYGLLYPAFCSYKAVKNKNVKEYVQWMMYWIVFAIYTVLETFVDFFFGFWFPFYYEVKIFGLVWLLSPATKGAVLLYRRVVHPFFTRHEEDIERFLSDCKLQTSNFVIQWGTMAFSYCYDHVVAMMFRYGRFGMMSHRVTRSYSYENFDSPDLNSNNFVDMPHLGGPGTRIRYHSVDNVNAVAYNDDVTDHPRRRTRRSVAYDSDEDFQLHRNTESSGDGNLASNVHEEMEEESPFNDGDARPRPRARKAKEIKNPKSSKGGSKRSKNK